MTDNIKQDGFDRRLTTVQDTMTAEIIRSKLASSGIPCELRPLGLGSYLTVVMGETRLGVDIYVPSDSFEDAAAVVFSGAMPTEEEIMEAPDAEKESTDEEIDENFRRHARNQMIFLKIMSVIAGIVFFVWLLARG